MNLQQRHEKSPFWTASSVGLTGLSLRLDRSQTLYSLTDRAILWLDVEKRLKRSEPNAMPDTRNLSLTLRVVGDYLDRKAVGDFAVLWSTDSVKVSYGKKVESFTREELYDLGVRMYLRRSSRLRK